MSQHAIFNPSMIQVKSHRSGKRGGEFSGDGEGGQESSE